MCSISAAEPVGFGRRQDLSQGMVTEAVGRARERGHWRRVEGCVADASRLPFAAASFDTVLACHMLYHVPDPREAVAEIARVLRSSGTAVIATNGICNMRELFDLRRSVFGGEHGDQVSAAFSLDNGRSMLEAVFATVELRRYPDVLVCTEPKDIVDYLTSSPPGDGASESQFETLCEAVATAFKKGRGKFVVTKDVGAFLCRGAYAERSRDHPPPADHSDDGRFQRRHPVGLTRRGRLTPVRPALI
jgi:SAM-dependent methyltransferase